MPPQFAKTPIALTAGYAPFTLPPHTIADFGRSSFQNLMKHCDQAFCDCSRHHRNLKGTVMTGTASQRDAERIYQLWDDALGKKDLEASLSLYADDASIESPL